MYCFFLKEINKYFKIYLKKIIILKHFVVGPKQLLARQVKIKLGHKMILTVEPWCKRENFVGGLPELRVRTNSEWD